MKKLLFIIIAFFFYTRTALISFAQVSFKGSAPQAVVVGEQFRVNYILNTAGERGKDPRLQEASGLKILSKPSISSWETSTTIINGNVSTQLQITFTYILMAEKEGEWTVPSATIRVGNSEYKSNKLKIKAFPSKQSNIITSPSLKTFSNQSQTELSHEDIFMQTQVAKSSVYKNEGFLVTFKLYTSNSIEVYNIKFPDFEEFIVQEVELPNKQPLLVENYQGCNYYTMLLRQVILYPQHAGKISIGKGKCKVIVHMRNNKSQRMHSIFDDPFDAYSDVKKTLISSPININVKPLPPNYPASFSGAVGRYQMTASISNTTKLKVNEPVTIKLALSGDGNIKMIKNPTIVFPDDFELYDPKVEVCTKVTPQGVNGKKNVEYYAIPRYTGDFVIPSIQFTYFDPEIKLYKTVSTEKYHLHIEPGENDNSSGGFYTINNNSIEKEEIRFVGQDIRHIKTSGFFYQKQNFFFGSLQYWLCYLFPIVLFFLWMNYHKKVQENANINLARTKKACKVATKKLKFARLYLKNNQKEAFYEEILKAVWGYLSDKWTIPLSDLTKDNVEAELIRCGVQEQLIKKFISILHTAEYARYSPSQNSGIMSELYQQTIESIQQMEKHNLSNG